MAESENSSSYRVVLLGDFSSGKDTFLEALPAISGNYDILIKDVVTYRIERDGTERIVEPARRGEFPPGTELAEIRRTLVERQDRKQGLRAFSLSLALGNNPGQLLYQIERGEIDIDNLTGDNPEPLNFLERMVLALKNVQFLIITLDIAYALTCLPVGDPELEKIDHEQSMSLTTIFDLFQRLGVHLENVPTAFCITKIDGKFLRAKEKTAMREITEALAQIRALVTANDVASALSDAQRENAQKLVAQVEKYWSNDLVPADWPENFKMLSDWYKERREDLRRMNDREGTLTLEPMTSNQIKVRLHDQLPLTWGTIHQGPYQSPNSPCEYFPISAIGRGYLLGKGGEPINIERVMNYIIEQAEEARQGSRSVPRWLQRFSSSIRQQMLVLSRAEEL